MGFYDIQGISLGEKAQALLTDPESKKALASVGRDGRPHVVFKGSLTVDNGNIRFFELIETSQTNKNLTYSLWFGKEVAINVIKDRTSFLIRGVPVRAIVSGKEFEEAYVQIKNKLGNDRDLSTVWIIKPTEVSEETFSVRQDEEREKYPLVGHLDRY
ncbi:MAG: hypothetical protein LBU85_02560 [Treponema sp.]|jgi:hypothetical protein|nr:hypothetical protein [Treponema sp.]